MRVAESNIVDLVNDAMRSRKTAKSTGRHHFYYWEPVDGVI